MKALDELAKIHPFIAGTHFIKQLDLHWLIPIQ